MTFPGRGPVLDGRHPSAAERRLPVARNRQTDLPSFIFIADETPLHTKLDVFETRASVRWFQCASKQTDSRAIPQSTGTASVDRHPVLGW